MKFEHKLVFHVPLMYSVGNRLEEIKTPEIVQNLIQKLFDAGYDSFYVQDADGYYTRRENFGRQYPEKLITLFTGQSGMPDDTKERLTQDAIQIFQQWIRKHDDELRQEEYAYELDGKLYTYMFWEARENTMGG